MNKIMWITGHVTRRIFHDAILCNLKRNQAARQWLCTTLTKPSSISDHILYPNANKKLKEYLDKLKETQSGRAHENGHMLNSVLQRYEHRLVIVDQYKELASETANESEEEMIDLVREEKQRFSEVLTQIDEEIIDDVIALNDNDSDVSSIMLEVQAGIGGQEAMLFAGDLFNMYARYIKFKRWDHELIEEDSTELGGVRSASILVRGYNAYEVLKHEAGVHRVQRIPKTEKGGRIHTSTAVVTVVPCADDIQIKLNPNDLRIETKRSSAPGGQNVNKLESAVRIVHIPSGIAVECQEERTQLKNKQIAMRKLHNKLWNIEFTKQVSSQITTRKNQTGLRTRNEKLRTYNFPQSRVTDHRISGNGGTVHNLDEFLSGNEHFDEFIENVNKLIQRQKLNDILDSKI
ncbi:peptide chain release factor 1-like, mitochondrial [Sitodiplosis mosellana]|uniref:peptide chain release factor 1-like, mitochondrial n=1 Tax=Sitodiplosis mosellana TaxID=263140 RepID=UPI002443AE51|nr:peptide chain release factor 1-like, mitochondrial [Sitodiplosis mosellana]